MHDFPEVRTTADAPGRLVTGLLVLVALGIVYGSWMPFDFDRALGPAAGGLFQSLSWHPVDIQDLVANVLVYLPLGGLLSLRLLIAGCGGVARVGLAAGTVLLCSVGCELGQVFIPQRHPSGADILCNGCGGLLGALAAWPAFRMLTVGVQRLKLALTLEPMRALFWIVAVLVLFAKLAPFDFVGSSADLQRSLAEARWSPFAAAPGSAMPVPETIVEMAGSFFAFLLLGVFGALWLRGAGLGRSVSAVNTLARLILLAVGVELAQLLLASHTCDAADVLAHIYGAAVGAILGATVIDRKRRHGSAASLSVAAQILLTAALVIQCAIIAGYALPEDAEWVAPGDDSIQWLPFYGHFQQPFAVGVGQIISSFLWYGTLAVIAAAVLPRRGRHYTLVMVSFVTLGVVTLTEAVQAFSVGHHADVTELLLALVASASATLAFGWVERYRGVGDTAPAPVELP